MSAKAGHKIKVYAVQQADGDADPSALSAYTEIGGIDDIDFGETRINLDKTDFKSTEDARKRFLGLFDGSASLNGFYDTNDAGQAEVDAAYEGAEDAVLWLMIAWTGTPADGTDHVKCVVEERRKKTGVEDRIDLSYSLNFSGKVSAGPTS